MFTVKEGGLMAERNWKRLKQSEVMDYGGELPARVVLEHDEEDHAYRTFLEAVSADSKTASRPHGITTGRRRR
jgi:hypothetical protein